MKKAEVSETMLKNSPEEIKNIFIKRIFSLINPKFEDENEVRIAEFELLDFANKCDLTPSEMILALEMCIKGKLYTEPNAEGYSERIKLFREIDRIKLGEVESAYLYFKTVDRNYEADTKQVKAFLDNKLSEETKEQRQREQAENRQKLREMLEKQTEQGQICRHGHLFYDEFSRNEDFPDFHQTAKEKWEVLFEIIKKLITAHKTNKNSPFSVKDLKDIEFIIGQGFEAFFIQRNSPTLTKIKALAKITAQNERVFLYLRGKMGGVIKS